MAMATCLVCDSFKSVVDFVHVCTDCWDPRIKVIKKDCRICKSNRYINSDTNVCFICCKYGDIIGFDVFFCSECNKKYLENIIMMIKIYVYVVKKY